MGPRLAKLPEKSGLTICFMVDIAIVNGGYFMVYKPTHITEGAPSYWWVFHGSTQEFAAFVVFVVSLQ